MTTRAPEVLTNSPMKYLVESIFLSTQREGSFDKSKPTEISFWLSSHPLNHIIVVVVIA